MVEWMSAKLAAYGLKFALFALGAAALFGGGYVWGSTHATGVAMEAGARAAQEQVAAVSASYQAMVTAYADKLKAQTARGDKLAGELDAAKLQIAADLAASKEKIAHVIPSNSACDLGPAALGILRGQAARH